MTTDFSVVIEKDEAGFFVASVPTLRGCHTQAKSLDVVMKRIREAIELCLEVEEPVHTDFVGIQRIAVTVCVGYPRPRELSSSGPFKRGPRVGSCIAL